MQTKAFAISVLLHLALLEGAFFLPRSREPQRLTKLEVKFNKPKSNLVSGTTKQKSNSNSNLPVGENNRVKKLLGLGSLKDFLAKEPGTQELQQIRNNWADADSYSSLANVGGGQLSAKEIRFINSLYRQIDNSIVENPYLSEYGHIGNVFFKFEIDLQGHLIESSLDARAEDPILKVIAARAIRKALKDENKELPSPEEKLTVNAKFTWADYSTCKNIRGTNQNYFSFCKYAEDKRKSFTTSEKASTYLKSLAYGFGAVEEIENYNKEQNRRKTKFDPFQELRNDPDYHLGT